MKTRCKFQCERVTKFAGDQEQIKLVAIQGGLVPEDRSFAQYTPSGTLEFHVTNPNVVGTFIPGKFYFLDITPAE